MPAKPWITEEYSKQLQEEHEKNPWTEEMAAKLRKQAAEEGRKAREEIEARLNEIGEVAFYKERIQESERLIEQLRNPTPEEKLKHTEAYFNDIIDALEMGINSFESMIDMANPALPKIPPTKYPKEFIYPKDKVTRKLFIGELDEGLQLIKMEGRNSRKELTAKVSINFDELKNVSISKDLSSYDREVLNAIVTYCIEGKNQYVNPLTIYRTMTGNKNAKLHEKQREAISESVTRLATTWITIDATDEATAYKMDKVIYEGNLIHVEKITGRHKGNVSEWIHVLKEPVLYQYANSKNQIGRTDINLLNTPIPKTEEAIILQGYLYDRINAMKNPKVSNVIVFDTLFKHIGLSAETDGTLRKKKSLIRTQIKESILKDWIKKGFIKGYTENKKGSMFYSITIER